MAALPSGDSGAALLDSDLASPAFAAGLLVKLGLGNPARFQESNLCCSPLSIQAALSTLAMGAADSHCQRELNAVLFSMMDSSSTDGGESAALTDEQHFSQGQTHATAVLNQCCDSILKVGLPFHQQLFLHPKLTVHWELPDTLDTAIEMRADSLLSTTPDRQADELNKQYESLTNYGLYPDGTIFEGEFSALLTSLLAVDRPFESAFREIDTELEESFFESSQRKNVRCTTAMMVSENTSHLYACSEHFSYVALDYLDCSLRLIIALPNPDQLSTVFTKQCDSPQKFYFYCLMNFKKQKRVTGYRTSA